MSNEHGGMYLDISGEWRPANPKLAGSGIVGCRPQVGTCPGNCADCFFKSGRYYEDLDRPHIPHPQWVADNGLLVRMNDGNDSNYMPELVKGVASMYEHVFFNTRIPVLSFGRATMLTVNGDDTDHYAHLLPAAMLGFETLVAVRVRVNSWNLDLCKRVIDHYAALDVPVRLTFMAYYRETVQEPGRYEWRKRTLNSYWVLRPKERARIEDELAVDQEAVQTCTTKKGHLCRDCRRCVTACLGWETKQ